jgi:hypothetical protein
MHIRLDAQQGSQPSASRDNIAGASAVVLTLSKGWQIELPDFQAEYVTLSGDYL